MLIVKVSIAAAALLVIVPLAYANPPKNCDDCIGDALLEDIKEYDEKSNCWYYQRKNFLPKVKLYSIETLALTFRAALDANNNVVEEQCKANVPLNTCATEETSVAMFKCFLNSAKRLGAALRKQELCHGKAIHTDELRIATLFVKGANASWKAMHPECYK